MALLGVDADYKPPDIIVIRGKRYRFYSFTEVWDAARHGLRPYEVHEMPPGPRSETGK